MVVKSGRGSSLLKDLKVLQMSQGSQTNTALKTANGQDRIVRTEDKLEWWHQHFESVTNVPTEVIESSLGRTPLAAQSGVDGDRPCYMLVRHGPQWPSS